VGLARTGWKRTEKKISLFRFPLDIEISLGVTFATLAGVHTDMMSKFKDDVQSLLAEAFPAPKPDCVKTRKLRYISGRGSLGRILPPEVLAVAGLVEGDRLEISAWSGSGTIKLRKAE
jgi:hypothetical protein